MIRYLHPMTSPEIGQLESSLILAIPLGATEQHGPHLGLGCDSVVARKLVDRLAKCRDHQLVIAPTLHYGSSGEHAGFPGTLSIGQSALEMVLIEIARSADAYRGVAFISGHGGNAEVLVRVTRTLNLESRRCFSWWPKVDSIKDELACDDKHAVTPIDLHAGRVETSILLFIAPELVTLEAIEVGNTQDQSQIIDKIRTGGLKAVTKNGVLGDPRGATPHEGEVLVNAMVSSLIKDFDAFVETLDAPSRQKGSDSNGKKS